MNYAAMQASMAAVRSQTQQPYRYNTVQNLSQYQNDLLKTIQILHYKKYELDNYLAYVQQQFTQTQMPSMESNIQNIQAQQVQDPVVEQQQPAQESGDAHIDEPKEESTEIIFDETTQHTQRPSYAGVVKGTNETNDVIEESTVKKNEDYSILFKKICHSCTQRPNRFCKYVHDNDENYYFYSLPLNKRCLRSVCFDLSCLRVHHTHTQRWSVRCDKPVCYCKHYVHPNDTAENKPFFWKSWDQSIPKPSPEETKSYFLLKSKK